jgi:hypothetical protein
MNYITVRTEIAGLSVIGFVTENKKTWLLPREVVADCQIDFKVWTRYLETRTTVSLEVEIEGFGFNSIKLKATAYPLATIKDFLLYLAGKRKKNAFALALLGSLAQADIERTLLEKAGFVVTSEQHESNRKKIRLSYLKETISNAEPTIPGHHFVSIQHLNLEQGSIEQRIAGELAYKEEKLRWLKENQYFKSGKPRKNMVEHSKLQEHKIMQSNAIINKLIDEAREMGYEIA